MYKKESVTFRVNGKLKEILQAIAKDQRRSLSNQFNIALEEWVRMKNELHPQFIKDIKKSLKSGRPEPIWKG